MCHSAKMSVWQWALVDPRRHLAGWHWGLQVLGVLKTPCPWVTAPRKALQLLSTKNIITYLACIGRLTRNKAQILPFNVSPAPHREIQRDLVRLRQLSWALMFQKCCLSCAQYRSRLQGHRHYVWVIQTQYFPLQPKWKRLFALNIDTTRSTTVFTLCTQPTWYRLPLSVWSSGFEFLLSLSQMKCLQFLRSYNRDKT